MCFPLPCWPEYKHTAGQQEESGPKTTSFEQNYNSSGLQPLLKPTCTAVGLCQQPADTCAYFRSIAVIQVQWFYLWDHKRLPHGRRVHHSEFRAKIQNKTNIQGTISSADYSIRRGLGLRIWVKVFTGKYPSRCRFEQLRVLLRVSLFLLLKYSSQAKQTHEPSGWGENRLFLFLCPTLSACCDPTSLYWALPMSDAQVRQTDVSL